MKRLTCITNESKQKVQIPLDDGSTIDFYLYFMPTQYSWYFDFTYNDYTSNGNKVVLTYNSLRHLKNLIPFGIAFLSDDRVEPFSIEDFASERIKIYILDKDEVKEIEEDIYNVD